MKAGNLWDTATFHNVMYVKNYDGDTVTVTIPGVPDFFGRERKIRLNGIDTPEIKGCKKPKEFESMKALGEWMEKDEKVLALAQKAKAYTKKFLDGKKIELRNTTHGLYGRYVADVYVDGVYLQRKLVDMGYAVWYSGKVARKDWCLMIK